MERSFFQWTGLGTIAVSGFTYGQWMLCDRSPTLALAGGMFAVASAILYLGAAVLESKQD